MTKLGWAFGDHEDEFIMSLEAILLHGGKKLFGRRKFDVSNGSEGSHGHLQVLEELRPGLSLSSYLTVQGVPRANPFDLGYNSVFETFKAHIAF